MKQILQDLANGNSLIIESPSPRAKQNHLIINTKTTLISAGTERMLVDFGKANFIEKARQQPDKVKMVMEKVQTDGLLTTVDAVKSKLGQPLPLGYCNVGIVKSVGQGVKGFKAGQRVASNGPHADVVRVPKNLCAPIPDSVSDEEAAFTVLASIGLQGIRLAKPTIGESFVVTGVGLIGLLTVQMLRSNGCRVLAIDFDESKLALAKQFGAEICNPAKQDPVDCGIQFSKGKGVDGVIITASTKSNDPVSQAAKICRKRGRIILVGVTGLELSRADFYEKELSFQVSCSYGPGRYDKSYEELGQDYPYGFVRWTEQRNFEAILDMMDSGKLDVKPLISHRFEFEQAPKAYELLTDDKSALGILLNYQSEFTSRDIDHVNLRNNNTRYVKNEPVVAFIGAGNYASRVLIPAFSDAQAQLHSIVTSGGVSGVIHGSKNGFKHAFTEASNVITNDSINVVAIATQHNTHAKFVEDCLKNNKNVFVEKPLAIQLNEVDAIKKAYDVASDNSKSPRLMVGFNRRFAPQIQKMKSLLDNISEPKSLMMTMNAGAIPSDHWTQDPTIGGGRIIGEACHFIDLMRYLVGHEIVSVDAKRIGDCDNLEITEDKAAFILGFADGSFGTIHYLANGANSFPKERIEVFTNNKVLQLDNFVKLRGYGWSGFKKMNLWKQDKGQNECVKAFISSIKNGLPSPIPADEIFEVARTSIEISNKLREQ